MRYDPGRLTATVLGLVVSIGDGSARICVDGHPVPKTIARAEEDDFVAPHHPRRQGDVKRTRETKAETLFAPRAATATLCCRRRRRAHPVQAPTARAHTCTRSARASETAVVFWGALGASSTTLCSLKHEKSSS